MKQLRLKKQIQNIIDDWICKQNLSIDKAIIKAINKRVKDIDIGEIFKNFIWGDDKKDVSDLIIYIKKNIIKQMK